MFIDKTGKSTIGKRSSMIFIICIAVAVLTGGNAFAQHYLNHDFRDSLTHKEKIALVHEESRHLSRSEVENRVKKMEKVSNYRNPDIKGRGSVRARLSSSGKVNLLMEENRNLMHHDLPRIRKEANKSQAVFHPGKEYVYGSFRANLSDAEKKQLEHEELQNLAIECIHSPFGF